MTVGALPTHPDDALVSARALPAHQHDGLGSALLVELAAWSGPATDPLEAILHSALLPAGKLLGPLLVLRSAAAVGGRIEAALPAAAAVAMVHAGSLVHDDVIDRDDPRRGGSCAHRRYGRDRAVLVGDALFFRVFAALAACRERGVAAESVVAATEVLARAGAELCRGVVRELDGSGPGPGSDVDDYLDPARQGVAVLLGAACRVGSIIGGGGPEHTVRLGRFGLAIGTACRIRDDLLPFTVPPSEGAGESAMIEPHRHPTLPLLLARRAGSAEDRRILRCLVNDVIRTDDVLGVPSVGVPDDPTAHFERLSRVLARTGALAAAEDLMRDRIELALRELTTLPDGDARTSLAEFARSVGDLPVPRDTRVVV